MEPRTFHGELTPQEVAQVLLAHFNHGNLHAQSLTHGDTVVVQIATSTRPVSGGQTALSVLLKKSADGVTVQMGKQNWLGIAASLGVTALTSWRNPFRLIDRLDDLAQDIEYLQLSDQVWELIETTARAAGATYELSERLRRMTCQYCGVGNPVGEGACIACGAPLGEAQPRTCRQCGFVLRGGERRCPNCKYPLD
jgi:hypothetical protein